VRERKRRGNGRALRGVASMKGKDDVDIDRYIDRKIEDR
jgi:hypothetical protein